MTEAQFTALVALTNAKQQSLGMIGAHLVLVSGLTRRKAAIGLDVTPQTVGRAVSTIERALMLARVAVQA